MKQIILTDRPVYLGRNCPYCGSKKTYTTCYINLGAPNIKCKNCRKEYYVSPEHKLDIK